MWNNMKLLLLLAAFIVLGGPGCKNSSGDGLLSGKKELAVILNEDSVMRIDPMLYSGRVTLLKKAEVVEVVGKSKEKGIVGNAQDYWYQVKNREGLSGWVFASNLKLFSNTSKRSVDNYISSFWEKETERLKKVIEGKWWSVDEAGDFTDHGIELSADGKYRSYLKGGREIKGEYNINYNDNEVVFLQGTTFNNNLNIVRRGTFLYLERKDEKNPIKFSKTSDTIDDPNDKKQAMPGPTEDNENK